MAHARATWMLTADASVPAAEAIWKRPKLVWSKKPRWLDGGVLSATIAPCPVDEGQDGDVEASETAPRR